MKLLIGRSTKKKQFFNPNHQIEKRILSIIYYKNQDI